MNNKEMRTTASTAIASISFSLLLLLIVPPSLSSTASKPTDPIPTPTPWPHQFHSVLFMNRSGALQMLDLWYDWPNGRNFNIIQNQLGKLTYDLEWTNGTSFIYTLDENEECKTLSLEVGILRPDWLDGANFLGQRSMDGFLCNVWEKEEFIWYYEDVVSKRPVYWIFYSGYEAHVMTFEVGRVLEDAGWQAPVYCFEEKTPTIATVATSGPHISLMKGSMIKPYEGRIPMRRGGHGPEINPYKGWIPMPRGGHGPEIKPYEG